MKVSDPGVAQQAIPSSNVAPSKNDNGQREPGKVAEAPSTPREIRTLTERVFSEARLPHEEPEHPPTERPPAGAAPDMLTDLFHQLEPLAAGYRKALAPSYAERLELMTRAVLAHPHQYDLSNAVDIAATLLDAIDAQAQHRAAHPETP